MILMMGVRLRNDTMLEGPYLVVKKTVFTFERMIHPILLRRRIDQKGPSTVESFRHLSHLVLLVNSTGKIRIYAQRRIIMMMLEDCI